jgi:hypothetical protein
MTTAQSLYICFIESEAIFISKLKNICKRSRTRTNPSQVKNKPCEMVKYALGETEPGFGSELSTFHGVYQEYE